MTIKTPTTTDGPYVIDARGGDICECYTHENAKAISATLNSHAAMREALDVAKIPGGMDGLSEWCDYWHTDNDAHKSDLLDEDTMRADLAFAAELIRKLTAVLSGET